MNDCWDQSALRRLLDAIDNEPPCDDPDCDVCHPATRPPVRAFNTTKATVALTALLAIIVLGVLLS